MILKGESETILCSGKFSGNSCLVGQIYRIVEIKVSFKICLLQMCLDEKNEDQRSEMNCLKSHSYHMTEQKSS